MPRLFLGNFDFEHRLAEPNRQLPAKLERINAELATAWLAIADEGDFLWTPQPIDADFFEQAADMGLPRVTPVVSFEEVPKEVECVPWGWTDTVRSLCKKYGWSYSAPPQEAVRLGNSRQFSAGLEHEWQVGAEFSGEVASYQDVERFLSLLDGSSRWVIKAEFGMSGRERIIGCGPPTPADRNWIDKRIASDGAVFFEPWLKRIREVGIQIEIPHDGVPTLIGIAPMIVDNRGQYAGSLVRSANDLEKQAKLGDGGISSAADSFREEPANSLLPDVPEHVVEVALRAARRLQEIGYFGPLGIDSMIYQSEAGTACARPLQDINARWTMGRLSLGFRRFLNADEMGFWHHGSDAHETSVIRRFQAFLAIKGRSLRAEHEQILQKIQRMPAMFKLKDALPTPSENPRDLEISLDDVSETLHLMEEAQLITKRIGTPPHFELTPAGWPERFIKTSPSIVGEIEGHHQSCLSICRTP